LDLVEKLAEAIESAAQPPEPQLARLIGRTLRDLPGILGALGYQRVPETEGVPAHWRRMHAKHRRKQSAQPDNAFSALADLLPEPAQPPRRRSGSA